tara:strand:+ start:1831 stop:2025 length:195 start_codon:yes stop_codon:yes gene_type:complete
MCNKQREAANIYINSSGTEKASMLSFKIHKNKSDQLIQNPILIKILVVFLEEKYTAIKDSVINI